MRLLAIILTFCPFMVPSLVRADPAEDAAARQ
jgi:hypothetical protein